MHRTISYPRTLIALLATGAVSAAFTGCSGDGLAPPDPGEETVVMAAEPPPP